MFRYEDLIRLTNRYTPPLNPEAYFREMGLLDDIPLPILGYTYEGYPLPPSYVLEERPPSSSSTASSGTPSPSAYVPRQQNAFPSWSPPPPYESEERPLPSPESPPPPYEPEERPLSSPMPPPYEPEERPLPSSPESPPPPYELDTMFVEDDDEEDTDTSAIIIIDDEEDANTSAIIIIDDEEDDIKFISYQPPRPSVIQYAYASIYIN